MVFTKNKIDFLLLILFLAFYPFGQLLRLSFNFGNSRVNLHPIDLVVGIIFILFFVQRRAFPKFSKTVVTFAVVAIFSYIVSFFVLETKFPLTPFLYLLRLCAYTTFLAFVANLTEGNLLIKKKLFNCLILILLLVGTLGWIQYLFFPDLRDLKYIGWDDHYFRMVGSFIDPGYLSLILVFGGILSFAKYLANKKISYLLLFLFFAVSIAFTYSRAGYLAFFVSLCFLLFKQKLYKIFAFIALSFLIMLFILPRPGGEGVRLERLFSVEARLQNYSDSIQIIQKSPLLGVGFNNICIAKDVYLEKDEFFSNSCWGLDSSILFILATTGVIGLIIFLSFAIQTFKYLDDSKYKNSVRACLLALLVHSFFSNSFFYPWMMGFFAILIPLGVLKTSKKQN